MLHMDVELTSVATVATLLVLAAAQHAILERRWRWRWREVLDDRAQGHATDGVYRSAPPVPRYRLRAPTLIRAAGFTSIFLGQLFVPGLIASVVGMLFAGLGLVSLPALVWAAKLYAAGRSLLRRDPRVAYFRARTAVSWALWVHSSVLLLSLVLLASPLRPESHVGWWILGGCDLLSVASILQAWLLVTATRVYEDALFAASAQPWA
jgi:hypothetical protein